MKENTTYTARDGRTFDNRELAEKYDYIHCTKENEAFVIKSSFYGQFRKIVKTYAEVQDFREEMDEKLIFERVSLGKYGLLGVYKK